MSEHKKKVASETPKPVNCCATPGCNNKPAYKTNKRPAFCRSCISKIFNNAGLELLEEFEKPNDYYLCRCIECGEVAHYRFTYLLDSNGFPKSNRDSACHICHWRNWYREGDAIGAITDTYELSVEQAEELAEKQNAVIIKTIDLGSPGQKIYLTKCKGCGLIEVERTPCNHEKCRPLKASMKKAVSSVPPEEGALSERTYPGLEVTSLLLTPGSMPRALPNILFSYSTGLMYPMPECSPPRL